MKPNKFKKPIRVVRAWKRVVKANPIKKPVIKNKPFTLSNKEAKLIRDIIGGSVSRDLIENAHSSANVGRLKKDEAIQVLYDLYQKLNNLCWPSKSLSYF